MSLVRRIGALILSAAAIAVFFLMSPKSPNIPAVPEPASHAADISAAQSAFSTNNAESQYIYGQIYASGVASKDMLTILAQQADDAAAQRVHLERAELQLAASMPGPDQRIPAELVLVLLCIALLIATTPREGARPAPSPDQPEVGAILPA